VAGGGGQTMIIFVCCTVHKKSNSLSTPSYFKKI
jgi:hypothetical protein